MERRPGEGGADHDRLAGVGSYDRTAHLRRRAHVRLDRFAIFEVGRKHRLRALERWLLVALTMLADFRTGEWLGTISALATDDLGVGIGASRKALSAALDRLEACGLISIIEAFGPSTQGRLKVLAYGSLVIDAPAQLRAEQREVEPHLLPAPRRKTRSVRADSAPRSRPVRDDNASNDAKAPALTCDDALAQGSNGGGEQGTHDSRDNARAIAMLELELGAVVVQEHSRYDERSP